MNSGSAGARPNGGGRGDGGGGAVVASAGSIPPGSRKIVQNLKEIVNCPEAEIYAMLKECNMDPSEAVNRLLNQDTFQEVKSKRDKKKEIKDVPESKFRGSNNISSRGGRTGNDRVSRVGSNNSSSYDYGTSHGKPLKKENIPNAVPGPSILGSAVPGNAMSRTPYTSSIPASADASALNTTDGISLSSKPSLGFQHAWSGVSGQISMADIVRMGRPLSKFSSKPDADTELPCMVRDPVAANDFQVNAKYASSTVLPPESTQEWQVSQDNASKVSEAIYDPNPSIIDEPMPHDELVNHLHGENNSTVFMTSSIATVLVEPSQSSSLHDDGLNLQIGSHLDGNTSASTNFESLVTDSMRADASCDGQLKVPDGAGRLSVDDASFENLHCSESQKHTFEHREAEDMNLSTVATNLQNLQIKQDGHEGKRQNEHPAVIFPEHLQVTSANCSHLSFGSFGSGGAILPGPHMQKTLPSNLEQPSTASDISSFGHVDAGSTEFYNDEQIKSTSEENTAASGDTAVIEDYEQSSSSQLTSAETDATRPANELQYNMSSLLPGHHAFSSTPQTTATDFNHANTRSQAQDLASISSMVQAYVSSLQSNILSSGNQPGREFDPSYLPTLASQPLPTKYNTVAPPISEPAISIQETLKSSFFSEPQGPHTTSQTLESTSIPAGAGVPQHLPVHPYSQAALPLGHFPANVISYPFLHPSYTYMPSAFQPAYTSSSAYHQSPTAAQSAGVKYTLPPQYKNNLSLNSLPQSAAVPSGYGGFGSSANIPGNFVLNNPPSAPANTSNLDDALVSQYKESSAYASLQQGGASRTMSGLPANTYYSIQGQSQHSGFRQGPQQPSQYGNLGYTNFYRSQVGVSQENHQSPSEVMNLSASQGLPSQLLHHHLWQRNY